MGRRVGGRFGLLLILLYSLALGRLYIHVCTSVDKTLYRQAHEVACSQTSKSSLFKGHFRFPVDFKIRFSVEDLKSTSSNGRVGQSLSMYRFHP